MYKASNTTELILVRHGETLLKDALLGRTDAPLSIQGRETINNVANRLAGERLCAIYSSDLRRACQSAEIIAHGRNLPIVEVPALREMNMGKWDGRSFGEIMQSEPEALGRFWSDVENQRAPAGESLSDLKGRVLPCLKEIVKRHVGERICVVAHGGVNRVILFEALGLSLANYYSVEQKYGALNRIRYFGDGNSLVALVNG